MTKQYQHKVSIWNYDTEVMHRGIFRDQGEAQAFMDHTEGEEKIMTCEYDNWPFGIYHVGFNKNLRKKSLFTIYSDK